MKKMLSLISAVIMATTLSLSAVSVSAETINNTDNDLWMVEYLTNNEIIYQKNRLYVLDNGEIGMYGNGNIGMVYILPMDAEDLNAEMLGLSDEYELYRFEQKCDLPEGLKAYRVELSTLEEVDVLYNKAVEMVEAGVISNAYKECSFYHGCNFANRYFILELKENVTEFDFSCIEGYDNLEIIQSETDDSVYSIYYSDGFEYVDIMNAYDTIVANENVELFKWNMNICCVAHTVSDKKYVIDETEKDLEDDNMSIDYSMTTIAGDVDLNNEQGISDIVTLSKFNANPELYPITDSTALANADMNQDGEVNTLDATILIEMALGTYESAVE